MEPQRTRSFGRSSRLADEFDRTLHDIASSFFGGFGGFGGSPVSDERLLGGPQQQSGQQQQCAACDLIPSRNEPTSVGFPTGGFGSAFGGQLAVDVVEKKNGFEIVADVPPGVPRENLRVRVTEDPQSRPVLTISCENTKTKESPKGKGDEEGTVHRSERSWTYVSRSLTLPPNVDSKQLNAKFEQGVLKVCVPKVQTAQKKGSDVPIS